jgi:hypothetical protein
MVEWLAVIAFCMNEQCAFWINLDKPFSNEAECRRGLAATELYLRQQGATSTLAACAPLKWLKV